MKRLLLAAAALLYAAGLLFPAYTQTSNTSPLLAISPPMNGLSLYLQFTEGTGNTVHDVSGSGNSYAIAGQGTPAAWQAVGLVLNSQLITVPNGSGRPTYGVCGYFPAQTPGVYTAYAVLSSSATATQPGFYLFSSSGQGTDRGTSGMYPSLRPSNGGVTTSAAEGFTGAHCAEFIAGTNGNTPTNDVIVVDGHEVSYLTQTNNAYQWTGGSQLTNALSISSDFVGGTGPLLYSVWAADTYDTVAQAAARTSSELKRIAALGAPVGGPSSNGSSINSCTVTGTAIDYGYTASQPPSSLMNLDFNCPFTNFAFGGQPTKDMLVAIQDREAKVIHPNALRNIALHGGPTNSVVEILQSPEHAVADMVAWSRKMHALGYKTIATTMLSRSSANGYNGLSGDALKNQVNALLLAYGDEFDWVANVAANPLLGADGASTNSTYFNGGVTLTNAGQIPLLAIERAGFEGVYGNAGVTSITESYTQGDIDRQIIFAGSNAATLTLKDAQYQSFNSAGIVCVKNSGTAALTLSPVNNEVIDGNLSLTLGSGDATCLRPFTADLSASGANWITTQRQTKADTSQVPLTCNGNLTIPFTTDAETDYLITTTADCSVSFAGQPASNSVRRMRVIFTPTTYTVTFPAVSSTMLWNGGTVPSGPTSSSIVAFHLTADASHVYGND